ncbi:Branched-chain amino acid ABC transporter, ATP-binding protein LivF (TC 3.A.1.4.1) [Olavius sp. associated proteobacterium Delta 1]|nr:Branched-chain amino acid ABC transporter, ATP-binding protein LivF (TC 3.A.1.4.1) [Olavius sp. associated proteobacterium Delta 1]
MLLEIDHIKIQYDGADIVKDLSLTVQAGEIVTIIGSNGAGKTTALRAISGLKRPAAGEIRFQGKRLHEIPAQDIVKLGIGHVPQGRQLFPYMTVMENIKLGAYLQNDKTRKKESFTEIFETFPQLKARKNQQASTLSGGEQQMLAIARALMGNPILLLMDEPSIGLAPLVVREIAKIALDINKRGTSILLVEQNARMALKISHRGYVLETGKLILEGKCTELINDERVKKAYLGQ